MNRLVKKSCAVLCAVVLIIALAGCSQDSKTVATVASAPDAVSVLQNIKTTQYFTDEAVAQEDVETIVQAGINAPSAMNGQPWHFSVITDAEVLQQISEGMGGGMGFGGRPEGAPEGEMAPPEGMTPPEGFAPDGAMPEGQPSAAPAGGSMNKAGITDAPLVVVISCKAGSELDAGLACQNMSGAAQLLDYGTKILTSPTMALNGSNQDTFRELLGIPDGYSAAAILLIGHEDTSVDTTVDGYTGATTRNPADEMVTYLTAPEK